MYNQCRIIDLRYKVHLERRKNVNMRAYRTCTSVARIIIVSTGVFSEMNFLEDVYAKGSKDTFARRLTRPYPPYVVVGCTYEEGRRITLRNGGSIFPVVSQRNPDGDMYLVGESCIYLADGNISQESSL